MAHPVKGTPGWRDSDRGTSANGTDPPAESVGMDEEKTVIIVVDSADSEHIMLITDEGVGTYRYQYMFLGQPETVDD